MYAAAAAMGNKRNTSGMAEKLLFSCCGDVVVVDCEVAACTLPTKKVAITQTVTIVNPKTFCQCVFLCMRFFAFSFLKGALGFFMPFCEMRFGGLRSPVGK